MTTFPFQRRIQSEEDSDSVRKVIENLTSTPLQRSFLVEDVLIRRSKDQDFSDLSFLLRRNDTSTGNFQVRENCQNLLRIRWENKGVQGILNLLNQSISLEEEIKVEKEFEEKLNFLQDQNKKLLKEVSILRHRLGETEKILQS